MFLQVGINLYINPCNQLVTTAILEINGLNIPCIKIFFFTTFLKITFSKTILLLTKVFQVFLYAAFLCYVKSTRKVFCQIGMR